MHHDFKICVEDNHQHGPGQPGNSDGLAKSVTFGSTLAVDLAPYEVRILNFDKGVRDWSRIRSLQARTPESTIPSPKAADRR